MVTGYGSCMLFLTCITYTLPWHLVENILAPVPWVRLIIMCHKMVIFLSMFRLLSSLVFTNDPCFQWEINFRSKTNASSKGKNTKHFLLRSRPAKLTQSLILSSFPTQTKSPKTVQSFSVQLCSRDLISAISYVSTYIQLGT